VYILPSFLLVSVAGPTLALNSADDSAVNVFSTSLLRTVVARSSSPRCDGTVANFSAVGFER